MDGHIDPLVTHEPRDGLGLNRPAKRKAPKD
jgi:hypothetical protein